MRGVPPTNYRLRVFWILRAESLRASKRERRSTSGSEERNNEKMGEAQTAAELSIVAKNEPR